MALPVDSFSFLPVADMSTGTIFRQREVWHLKSQNVEDDQDIVILLTGPNAGQWFHVSAFPKMECLALAPGNWRAEFSGIDQIKFANAPQLALGLSSYGTAVHGQTDVDWTWAGLDGRDHTPVYKAGNFQTWIKAWSVVLVDAKTNSTIPLFDVAVPE